MHGLGALRKRIQQRGAPATGRIRCRFLVGLFVGLREKLHLRILNLPPEVRQTIKTLFAVR